MLDAHDIAMIVRRMIAYWLLIILIGALTFVALRAWRARRRDRPHKRHRRRR